MITRMDGVRRDVVMMKTQLKEELFFAVTWALQILSKVYAEVNPTTGTLLISALILDPFHNLQSCRSWDKGTAIHPDDKTSYTTHNQGSFLKYVENEYGTRYWHMPVNTASCAPSSNLIPSAMASESANHRSIPLMCPAMMKNT
jgi:hypothetical protein